MEMPSWENVKKRENTPAGRCGTVCRGVLCWSIKPEDIDHKSSVPVGSQNRVIEARTDIAAARGLVSTDAACKIVTHGGKGLVCDRVVNPLAELEADRVKKARFCLCCKA